MSGDPRLLVVTGGHPFEREPFFAVFDAIAPGRWTHAPQPDAQLLLNPAGCAEFEAIVFYDMPGITFTRADPPTLMPPPPNAMMAGLRALMDAGKGLVFLHHAVASWPATQEFAEIIGARFHYQPGSIRGVGYPDSGYRFDVSHEVQVLDQLHPVCEGLGSSFTLTDELYLYPVLTDDVVPLMRTTFPMDDPSQFFSADAAIRGRRNTNEGWSHPHGSDLVGWAKHASRSAVVYLQFGDGPDTYADVSFRRALDNAVRWVSSAAAREWASSRNGEAKR